MAGVAPPPANNDATSIAPGIVSSMPSYGGSAGMVSYGSTGLNLPAAPYLTPPAYQPFNAPPVPNVPLTSPGTYNKPAPTPTPYGTFTAPDPTKIASDPYYQFRFAQGENAIQRGAAARGTLLSGGTLKALNDYASGSASEEEQAAFNRALAGYNTNRDTNAQNFGQQLGSFNAGLGAFGANTNATLGFNNQQQNQANTRFGEQYDTSRQAWQDAQDRTNQLWNLNNLNNAASYARQVAQTQSANDAIEQQQQRDAAARIAANRPRFTSFG